MKKKLIISMVLLWASLTCYIWVSPKLESSSEERRKLTQFPPLTLETIMNGDFTSKFESYAQDQFPHRFEVRQAKAMFRYYGMGVFENNGYFIDHKKIMKMEYPLNESEIIKAGQTFTSINQKYFNDDKVYVSIIPDKSYYTDNKTIPTMDYERMESLLLENMKSAEYIDIKSLLTKEDFYNTDIHWKQESIEDVSKALLETMNKNTISYDIMEIEVPFTGVYDGHSALSVLKDDMKYVVSDGILEARVNILEKKQMPVYSFDALNQRDQYDFFLYGPQAIVEIENELASSDEELIIFRDSFGSSLAPYFIDSYKKVTLVDIRYISSNILDEYIDFNDQDILFIYSGTILNSSSMFK